MLAQPLRHLCLSDRSSLVRRDFLDRSRDPIVTLGLSDRCHCGAVAILKWFAQSSRQFGRVRLRVVAGCSFWSSRKSCTEILTNMFFYREFASRSCTESYYKDFVQRSRQGLLRRSCQQSSFRAFVQDFFHDYCQQQPCSRDLVERSCEHTSYAQRHCTGLCCTDFAKKSCTRILPVFGERLVANLPRSPLQRSWQEMAGELW